MSDTDTMLSYSVKSSNGTGHLVKSDLQENKVRLLTLDNLVQKKYSKYPIDLLKIDTDGFDFKVIRGSELLIQKWHPFIYFEWDKSFLEEQGEKPCMIFSLLYDCEYKKLIIFDNFGNPLDVVLSNNEERIHDLINNTSNRGPIYYYDVLAVPNECMFSAEELFALFHK